MPEAAPLPAGLRQRPNLILIGMPGAGKSTIGRLLARRLGMSWLDTDRLIEGERHASLQALIDRHGLQHFRQLEEAALLSLACRRTVVATGGSAVYSEAGMAHLRTLGVIVWLDAPLPVLVDRIHNLTRRGLVMRPDQDLATLYAERLPLYRRWAEIHIPSHEGTPEQAADRVLTALPRLPAS